MVEVKPCDIEVATKAGEEALRNVADLTDYDHDAMIRHFAAHREAAIAPLVEAATRFDRFFSKALEGFTEGWAERQTPSHVAFAWNDAHLTVGDFLALRYALQSLGENGK